MQDNKKNKLQSGFTLIEMLIVAPLIIIFIGVIIVAITSLTGSSLRSYEQNSMEFQVQDALDTIKSTTLASSRFLTTTSNLTSPQGLNNNTTNFSYSSSPNTLILTVPATTTSPVAPSRKLIYAYTSSSSECNNNPVTEKKSPYSFTIVFFVKNNSLWKRTIADPGNPCSTPWQRSSCAAEASGAVCKAKDEKLTDNVAGMTVDYYPTADEGAAKLTSITGPSIPGNTIEVKLTLAKTVSGEDITQTGSVKTTRQNDLPAESTTPPTTTPTVSYSIDNTTSVTFEWNTVSNATSYNISYSLNGSAYTTPISVAGNSYTINTVNRDSVTMRVAAKNNYGTTANGQATAQVPSTIPCDLQNNWANYGSPYVPATFTKTKLGVVALSGLIRSGTGVANEVICVLPPGYRPSAKLIFAPSTNGTTQGRIDIETNGEVKFNLGSTGWISLNGINFLADGASWTNVTGTNGWTTYGAQFATPQVSKDSSGRVFIQGLAKSGTMGSTVAAFTLPSSFVAPATRDIYPARAGTTIGAMDVNTDKTIHYRSGGNGYWSMQAMYYPSSGTSNTWYGLSTTSSWVAYGAPYSTAQYTKNTDGIVSLRGMIKGGIVTGGTTIATLPVGYRPAGQIICSAVTNPNTYGRYDVLPDGKVQVREGVNNGWLSLAGCDFLAEN